MTIADPPVPVDATPTALEPAVGTAVPAASANLHLGPPTPIEQIVVVVPVHNERDHLAACLDSLHRARSHRLVRRIPVRIVVVLDRCDDGSHAIALAHLDDLDQLVVVDLGRVGAARHAGVERALADRSLDPRTTWLAHTDADTIVPPHWLARHLSLARRHHAAAGVVRVDDWSDHPESTRRSFDRHYGTMPFGSHPHVHGANLGVRADAYLAVGGFPAMACHEDHALWHTLGLVGSVRRSSRRLWVTTSGRARSRVSGGFADSLSALTLER